MLKNIKKEILGPFRVSSETNIKIVNRANKLYPNKTGRNKAQYIMGLIDKDLLEDKPKAENDCPEAEAKFMLQQVARVGNNLNQIAHGINMIKDKKFLSPTDKSNIEGYYKELSEIRELINKLV